jgi:hypothetical protein
MNFSRGLDRTALRLLFFACHATWKVKKSWEMKHSKDADSSSLKKRKGNDKYSLPE